MKPEDIEFVRVRSSSDNIGWDDYDFYWEGKKCTSKIIHGVRAKRREALSLISSDLSSCWEYLCLMTNDNDSLIQSALYKALVVTYAKCFVSGKERGLSLKDKEVFKNADCNMLNSHQSIMETRHKFVAHSDSGAAHQAEICVIYPPHGHQMLKPHVVSATAEYQFPTGKSMEAYIHTVSFVMDYVTQRIQNSNNHIVSSENV